MATSSIIDINKIVNEIKNATSRIRKGEENIRENIEFILRSEVYNKLSQTEKEGLQIRTIRLPNTRYEVTLISGGRIDALHGNVIIEYEEPGKLKTKKGIDEPVTQVENYIKGLASDETKFSRYFGVVLDGYKIGFVRYRQSSKQFEVKGPFDIDNNTVAKLVEAIIGLRRRALGAEELLSDFGPESDVAKESIRTFYNKLQGTSPRTKALYEDWKRVFSQVCAYSPEKITGLGQAYGLGEVGDSEKLLFALHTYYALIMKLLAAEVASVYMTPMFKSYLRELEDAYYKGHEELKAHLSKLEEGGIFTVFGIMNFLEADYFGWYLDEWDEQVAKCVVKIVDRLSNYDPSATELEPEKVRDLFKRLYQNLVPKTIRHDLGEYYTPDWLAEFVLNEAGWTRKTFENMSIEQRDPLDLRLLDPACGSGTFLMLAITRLKEHIEEHWIDKKTALIKIIRNIVGFDLNPLAVIACRVNYLIALGDILREKGSEPIEVPVYLADSIMIERNSTPLGTSYVLRTVVGDFELPTWVVEKQLLNNVLTIMGECIGKYSTDEFIERIEKELEITHDDAETLKHLFKTVLSLEEQGKDRIWLRILRNSFAPLLLGQFDYVVGNPPWVNWENLAVEFRKPLKDLYEYYGILPSNPNAQTKVDLSMIFAYRCMDRYLKPKGTFGFLINDAAFKAMAGNGFRKFRIGQNMSETVPFKVNVIHDFVTVKPFEDAANRTAMFIAVKGETTQFPIPYKKWFRSSKQEKKQTSGSNYMSESLEHIDLYAEPLGGYKVREEVLPFLTLKNKKIFAKLNKIIGDSYYRAHEGPVLIPSGVYRVKLIEKQITTSIVRNLAERDKKFNIKESDYRVENNLIYPIIESGDIKKWAVNFSVFAVIPYDSKARIYSEHQLKTEYPNAFNYLSEFREALTTRSHYKKYGSGKPFYFIHMFSEWMLSNFKVVWNRMGNELACSVASPIIDQYLGKKPLIPEDVIAFINTDSEDEAHYICAILNSSIVNLILQSIAKGGKNFATPEFINNISIQKYDPTNNIHTALSKLSRRAHSLVQHNMLKELKAVENKIDKMLAKLYSITSKELKDIKRAFDLSS